MIVEEQDYLAHYGILRKSGRYPWGSGGTQSARNRRFIDVVDGLKRDGMSDAEVAKNFGITTTQLRAARSIAVNEQRQQQINQAQRLKDKGYSNVAIGDRMGINESSVRALLAPGKKDRADVLESTANMLKDQIDKKGYIDIGTGVENHVGVSKTRLATAVALLEEQGYKRHYVKVEQLGTGNQTTIKVLGKPDSPYPKREQIQQITDHTVDGGRSYLGIKDPLSISSKRVDIRYAEDGGAEADGVIYVRPGVKDVSIGKARYAQVRIKVDGTHYLKGMAVYKDDLPPGVDLQFNTNKHNTGVKHDAMKPIKDDPDNPFGATIRQMTDEKGNLTSSMNIVGNPNRPESGEEGSWETWSKNLSSQVLSKQSPDLAKQQLDMMFERKRNELDAINKLTNPAIRKKLLEGFADDADSSAVHLRAAALPGQATHVILPVNSMKPTEIYAPNYKNGTRVALIRYPHAGTFEIPELTVNNRNPEAQKLLGKQAKDAVGIHHKVAEHLSGADFDGDTVLVIPNNRGSLQSSPPLERLKGFDPQSEHPPYDGMRTIDGGTYNAKTREVDYPKSGPEGSRKQREMGEVTNLIADMTIRGANTQELARAVRHSMVVIDAEKHSLDFKSSFRENGIPALKEKYQGKKRGGASTLITKAKSPIRVPARRARRASEGGPIDPETGRKVFVPTGETRVDRRTGKTVPKEIESQKLKETDDAFSLIDGIPTPIERVYAEHSNRLKSLANTARKETLDVKPIPISKSAKDAYAPQVATLNSKLNVAEKNAPLERQAQLMANVVVSQKRAANPNLTNAEIRKIKNQALAEQRVRNQAGKERIHLTDEEWHAIQAGAISNHRLERILANADLDRVRELATPKQALLMTATKKSRAAGMLSAGYTQAEVAEQLGVSLSTLKANI